MIQATPDSPQPHADACDECGGKVGVMRFGAVRKKDGVTFAFFLCDTCCNRIDKKGVKLPVFYVETIVKGRGPARIREEEPPVEASEAKRGPDNDNIWDALQKRKEERRR